MTFDFSREATFLARSVLRLLRPHDLVGAPLVRIGRNFDGGYVMVDRFDGIEAAYSLGINDDVSWDFDVAQRGIDLYQYDHTIDHLPFEHQRFHWKKLGISHVAQDDLATLEQLVEDNGHGSCRNMILKCDIEGHEWLSLTFCPNRTIAQFSQIVLEIHGLGELRDQNWAHTARQAMLNLTASHHVVHVHANNYAGVSVVGGIPVPDVLEVTLARKDMGEFRPSTKTFPTDIDTPCDPHHADIFLGAFTF